MVVVVVVPGPVQLMVGVSYMGVGGEGGGSGGGGGGGGCCSPTHSFCTPGAGGVGGGCLVGAGGDNGGPSAAPEPQFSPRSEYFLFFLYILSSQPLLATWRVLSSCSLSFEPPGVFYPPTWFSPM